ncbi:hypothetical protein HAX54_023817 [Datura stramonium]|uniref:Endonuclease/exonuclease/phosphatase domain-containing protein n=1 Tax=Datura stramonium TaxID=4076 RepID=A0ABS8UZ80_DATST|nr:hypothetical protein [Datura stramonium]
MGNWNWVVNYLEAPGGRIWVIWNPNLVNFTMIAAHKQFIHGQRDDLKMVMNGLTVPGLVMGDFNSILSADDRINGTHVHDNDMNKEFLHVSSLVDLKTIAQQFTWSNNHILSRMIGYC